MEQTMENEKQNTVLTDEELKEVNGGKVTILGKRCDDYTTEIECKNYRRCFWLYYVNCNNN